MIKTVEINGKTYIVEFIEKDTSVDYIKWHNFFTYKYVQRARLLHNSDCTGKR